MTKAEILKKVEERVKRKLEGEGTGHDWLHIERVVRNALSIGRKEGGDLFIVQLGALLHDIADWKFNGGDHTVGSKLTREILEEYGVENDFIEAVAHIVGNVSFGKGIGKKNPMRLFEGKIVQDADRLDAIGAIGVARAFAYGGYKQRPLYDPNIKPIAHKVFTSYKQPASSTINHFYEKMLLLKDKMNTRAGKEMAKERHEFTKLYLKHFFREWRGK